MPDDSTFAPYVARCKQRREALEAILLIPNPTLQIAALVEWLMEGEPQ